MNAPFFSPARAIAVALCLCMSAPSLLEAQTLRSSSSSSRGNSRSSSPSRTSSGSSLGSGIGSSSASTSSRGASSSTGGRQYRSNTLLEDALIQVDAESRSIVVVTDDKTQEAIAKVIRDLDKSRPQVLIKVVFVEVSLDKNLDAGIEGSYTFNTGGKSGTAGSLFGLGQLLAQGSPAGYGAFGAITASNWSATLHALATCGRAKVLSRPSIMARNNQEAVIVVGQQVPIVTGNQITDTGNVINTIQYQDVGIILKVTPFITSNKSVEMIVAPEISDLSSQTVAISNNLNAPIIDKRSAETVVVTPNATTIVIGGLMKKETSSTVKKVPLLGDIPILGIPFRYTVKNDSKSELLIFLTPYIVENDQSLDEITLNEANRAELMRDMLSPEDVRNNLDTLRLIPDADPDGPPPGRNAARPVYVNAASPAAQMQARQASAPAPRAASRPAATPKPAAMARPLPSATPRVRPWR